MGEKQTELQGATGLKQMFQNMVPVMMEIVQGKVMNETPLKIQIINDEKMIVTENILCLPRHLSTYQTKVDIFLEGGNINSLTKSGQGTHPHETSGAHPHGPSGGHSRFSGDGTHDHPGNEGDHTHPSNEGSHVHNVSSFNITGASMTVYNHLKKGEIVYILSFNHGKK